MGSEVIARIALFSFVAALVTMALSFALSARYRVTVIELGRRSGATQAILFLLTSLVFRFIGIAIIAAIVEAVRR